MSSDWVKSFSDIAGYAKNAAQQASTMMAGSELERKLAEATSNEPWGASSTMLQEISRATFAYDDFKTVMLFVWRSAQNQGALWRVTYKTLNMLDYILRHGSERVIEDAKDHLREIKKLQKFEYVDPDGKDQGVNVREKARQLVEMLTSEEALNAERDKARATRNKYGGVSAAEMSGGGGGGGGGGGRNNDKGRKGFSDEDFKYAADRDRRSSGSDPVMGLTSLVGGLVSSATEYASAASKQLQSMQTLFPSNELDRKLTDCLSNDQQMPSSSLLYELGRATHREDDYRIILSAIWQNVLRSNQRPRVMLKTLLLLESTLLHGPDRALEETIDMKTDIKVLQSFSSTDFNEAGKVQAKANDIIELLDNSSNLQKKRRESADSVAGKFVGISSSDKPAKRDEAPKREEWAPDDGFGAAFDALKSDDPAPAPSNVNLFDVDAPAPAPVPAPAGAPTAASGLSANIGSIKVNINREGRERPRHAAAGGGISLGKLPTPAAAAAAAAAGGGAGGGDLFGLMDGPPAGAPPAAPPPGALGGGDLFGLDGPAPAGLAAPPAAGGDSFGADFGDFDSAAATQPAAPPKSAAEAMLENAMLGLATGEAPPSANGSGAAAAASAPSPPAAMGKGSGLGLASIPTMAPAARPPIGGGVPMGAGPMPPMGGGMNGGMGGGMRPMGGMGGMQPMGGMGGGGMQPGAPMGGMGGMGGMRPMGGMAPMGGMGGGMGQPMGGMGSVPMGGGMGGGMSMAAPEPPAAAPAPDPFANLMGK